MSMPTPKENFLRLVRHDDPHWLGNPWSCFNVAGPRGLPYLPDAINVLYNRSSLGVVGKKDCFGVVWDWPADQPGPTPRNHGEYIVVKDITHWQDYFEFPSLKNLDWAATKAACGNIDRQNKLVCIQSPRGMFEFSHSVMGFENALMNYLLEPDAMYELLSAYTDFKIESVKQAIDEMEPDIIINMDDWGSKTQLFLPPDTWRTILKPLYKRFYDYIHSRGVIIMQHNDSHAQEVCEDMAELGLDIWQGITPENDINGVVKRTEGKVFLLGGISMPTIDKPGVTETEVRAHIRDTMDKYALSGRFNPCFTSIMALDPMVADVGSDEMDKYGAVMAEKVFG